MMGNSVLHGKSIIVTGAASGIGLACARGIAFAGARTMLTDVDEVSGEAAAAALRAEGAEAQFLRLDATDGKRVKDVMQQTADLFGALNGAVNNAGIVSGPTARLHEVAETDWNRVVSLNLTGMWLSLKHEVPYLLEAGGGSIVNMASIAGVVASRAGSGAYGPTKHAAIGLTKTAAFEYASDGIRVNAVCPGVIKTGMVESMIASGHIDEADMASGHMLGRLGQPREVAEAAVWLLSDMSSFVTGHALMVDGGYVAQ
jgi:NAD(P)-dependent dehydrogenase (short-subunit alcohol dehydrogenase family)